MLVDRHAAFDRTQRTEIGAAETQPVQPVRGREHGHGHAFCEHRPAHDRGDSADHEQRGRAQAIDSLRRDEEQHDLGEHAFRPQRPRHVAADAVPCPVHRRQRVVDLMAALDQRRRREQQHERTRPQQRRDRRALGRHRQPLWCRRRRQQRAGRRRRAETHQQDAEDRAMTRPRQPPSRGEDHDQKRRRTDQTQAPVGERVSRRGRHRDGVRDRVHRRVETPEQERARAQPGFSERHAEQQERAETRDRELHQDASRLLRAIHAARPQRAGHGAGDRLGRHHDGDRTGAQAPLVVQPDRKELHVHAEHGERRRVEGGEAEPAPQRARVGSGCGHARIVP